MFSMEDQVSERTYPNYCFYSSFIFITNALVSLHYKEYAYSASFFALFLTSILYRTITNTFTNILDKVAIASVGFLGGNLFLSKFSPETNVFQYLTIICTFVSTIYLYCYGYYYAKYCYDNDVETSHRYHAFVHIFASFGHHLILLL
jgi:hypothetical protein